MSGGLVFSSLTAWSGSRTGSSEPHKHGLTSPPPQQSWHVCSPYPEVTVIPTHNLHHRSVQDPAQPSSSQDGPAGPSAASIASAAAAAPDMRSSPEAPPSTSTAMPAQDQGSQSFAQPPDAQPRPARSRARHRAPATAEDEESLPSASKPHPGAKHLNQLLQAALRTSLAQSPVSSDREASGLAAQPAHAGHAGEGLHAQVAFRCQRQLVILGMWHSRVADHCAGSGACGRLQSRRVSAICCCRPRRCAVARSVHGSTWWKPGWLSASLQTCPDQSSNSACFDA